MTAAATTTAYIGVRETSPRTVARLAGLFFLLYVVLGVYAETFIRDQIVVSGNAATTATNILAHESTFRLGYAIYLLEMAFQVVTTALFYELLKPVNKGVSALSATFSYIGIGIKTLARLFYLAPLFVLGDSGSLAAFSGEQHEALALVFLRVDSGIAGVALVFFGFATALQGYVMIKCTFLPRSLGWLAIVGGLGWLAYLSPPFGNQVFMGVALFALLGVLATSAWLLIVGVNESRWREQARAAAASLWR